MATKIILNTDKGVRELGETLRQICLALDGNIRRLQKKSPQDSDDYKHIEFMIAELNRITPSDLEVRINQYVSFRVPLDSKGIPLTYTTSALSQVPNLASYIIGMYLSFKKYLQLEAQLIPVGKKRFVDLINFIILLEQEYNSEVQDHMVSTFNTMQELLNYVKSNSKGETL